MTDEIKRKPEHVQRAREILELPYQDQLAIIGEFLAERDKDYQRGYDQGYHTARISASKYPESL